MKTAPFDLGLAEAGHPLITRAGKRVESFAMISHESYPIQVLVPESGGLGNGRYALRKDGRCHPTNDSKFDLFLLIEDDEPAKEPRSVASPIESQVGGDHSAEGPTPSRYGWSWNGVTFDFYRLCDILGIRHHAQARALKKLIRAGRSVKSLEQDLDETIDAILRWNEMIREDRQSADPEETK